MLDGVHIAEHVLIVALEITTDGTKIPLGVVEGSTENATLVGDLLAGMRDRGLDVCRPTLVVIDGSKALASAVRASFDRPIIALCQLHKIRNVESKLPRAPASTVGKKMRAAYQMDSALAAEASRAGDSGPPATQVPSRRGRITRGSVYCGDCGQLFRLIPDGCSG